MVARERGAREQGKLAQLTPGSQHSSCHQQLSPEDHRSLLVMASVPRCVKIMMIVKTT